MLVSVFLPAVFAATTALAQVQVDTESYTNTSRFEYDALRAHNRWRAEHGSVPLAWNNSLKDFARSYVEKCVWKHSGAAYGENLAAGFLNVTAAVDAWGNERELYDFSRAQFLKGTGHFTQVVWNATRSIGCAAVKCENLLVRGHDSWYVVCEYWPPGNVLGAFAQNVREQIASVEHEGQDSSDGEKSGAGGGEESGAGDGEESRADDGEESRAGGGEESRADGGEESRAGGGEESRAGGGEEYLADDKESRSSGGEESVVDGGEESVANDGEESGAGKPRVHWALQVLGVVIGVVAVLCRGDR